MNSLALPTALPEDIGLSSARLDRLTQLMQDEVAHGRVPGAVALIARRGKIGYFECYGYCDPVKGTPMSKDAIFRIYSMTKPIVTVAAMMLFEQGRILLGDPVSKYLPEFGNLQVAVARGDQIDLVPATRPVTIQDLLRHTSGLTYEFRGNGPVHKMYTAAKIYSRDRTAAEHVAVLGQLPLLYQPGTHWEYGRSTDVVGRLVEVLSGATLGTYLEEQIFRPLGMVDTAFHTPQEYHVRLAEAFAQDPQSGAAVRLMDVRSPPPFESGGAGLVSTAADYARFLQMMQNGGTLDDVRLLSRKTLEFMTADHLGSIAGPSDLLPSGYGFGLGFAVRLHTGIAQVPGSVGHYYWGGVAGTTFWVDPAEQLFAILLLQAPGQREYYRMLFRDMVYAAFAD
jgi:CubicO group peptidase (beta-lactamase class C family)